MPKTRIRGDRGSGIVVGVIALSLIASGTVLAVLMLVNVGGATYGKEKISFIATQAAEYATTLPAATRQAQVTVLVNGLLESMGYGDAITITISDLSVGARPAVKVAITAALTSMLSGKFAAVIPAQFQMTGSAVAITNGWIWGYASDHLPTTPQLFTAAMINATGALPNDGLPAWNVSLLGMGRLR